MSLNSLPTIPNQKEINFLKEITMNDQGGEPEWGSLAPVKYPSEASAVRVNNREVNQIWSNLLNF